MADEDVIALGTDTRLALKYVEKVAAVVCLIVPPSFVTIPSPSATAVVPALVSPSTIFNSVAVEATFVPPKERPSSKSVTTALAPPPSANINPLAPLGIDTARLLPTVPPVPCVTRW